MVISTARKDIECVFGALKKQFKILKTWSKFQKQEKIDNTFVTCCTLHNMLLTHDGFLDADRDITPTGQAMKGVANKNTGC